MPHLFPLGPQRGHHHRVNHQHNIVGAGVMGAKVGAFGGVQRPLEQCAEDGRLDVAPVPVGCFLEPLQRGLAQFNSRGVAEQVAVEVGDPGSAEDAAAGHLLEEVSYGAVEHRGIAVMLVHNLGEGGAGEQAGILGVEAKYDLVEVARQPFRVGGVLLHVHHDGLEQVGGLLGDGVHRAVGTKVGRGEEGPLQFAELSGLVQFGDGNLVPDGFHAGEVGLNTYGAERRYYEQRGRFQMDLVAKQLVQRSGEVIVTALELPAETPFEVGVGEAAGHPLFKGEGVPVAVFDGSRVAYQRAEVQEHFLGRLLLPEVDVLPLGDEYAGVQLGKPRQAGCGVGGRFRSGHFKALRESCDFASGGLPGCGGCSH